MSEFFLNRRIFGKVTSKNVVVSCTFFVFQQCVGQALHQAIAAFRGGGLAAGKDRNACRKGTAAAKTGIWPSPGPPLLENDAKTYSYEDNTVATERWQ